jgi:hypothetical protein
MKDPDPPPPGPAKPAPTPFDAFKELAGRIVRVPKEEADAKEVEYQRKQAKKPKRGPKPGHKQG